MQKISSITKFSLDNAKIIKDTLKELGYEVFGGANAPYLWVRFKGQNSWDIFQQFLEKYHIVTTPGAGFGSAGNEFIRLTAFGHRDEILTAVNRLKNRPALRLV